MCKFCITVHLAHIFFRIYYTNLFVKKGSSAKYKRIKEKIILYYRRFPKKVKVDIWISFSFLPHVLKYFGTIIKYLRIIFVNIRFNIPIEIQRAEKNNLTRIIYNYHNR